MKQRVSEVEPMRPTGEYTVELFQRGRKIEEIRKKNYITPVWENWAKAFQGTPMLGFGFPTGVSGASLWKPSSDFPPNMSAIPAAGQGVGRLIRNFYNRGMPFGSVILTDWADAEDTNEHTLRGRVSAWASVWKSASVPASGLRGQLNEAECSLNPEATVAKWVWDWSTQQGNGSYQTLAIGQMLANTSWCYGQTLGPEHIVWEANQDISTVSNPNGEPNLGSIGYNPVTKRWISIVSADNSGTATLYVSHATDASDATLLASDFDGSGMHKDLGDLTWSQMTGSHNWASFNINISNLVFPQNDNGPYYCNVYPTADGGYCGAFSNAQNGICQLFRVNSSGTTVFNVNRGPSAGASGFQNGAATNYSVFGAMVEVGSFYYATMSCNLGPNNGYAVVDTSLYGKVYRVNPADGTLSAAINLPTGLWVPNGYALTTDGTDLYVPTQAGILKMETDGTPIEITALPSQGASSTEAGLSPFQTATTSNTLYEFYAGESPSLDKRDALRSSSYTLSEGSRSTWGSATGLYMSNRLIHFDGSLWMCRGGSGTPFPNLNSFVSLGGGNMFSRALLDSPVTKTASQTMKVSYELTMPDFSSIYLPRPTL